MKDTEQQDREAIMALMVQIKEVVLFNHPHHAVVALARMIGFMLMVGGDNKQLNKDEFYSLLIGEVDSAYDSAVATRQMQETLDKMTGGCND
jgi:hypothetical protein